ncbi:flagellin [Rheinheimera baltica]|uniref:Flagellin n=1 Tax=Rheinheimera baltica TaxID=67576 RepID=A0ABT9HUS0_9GAMM|nr:flagellin [Rheinheimera baltica]MDP5134863.1 flagellin [Rheinheimera baltica]MDP5143175.1 flagellin [Rheinheimera baltica]MDP5149886.1 flagellin [Rheinheimera baltica]
MKINNQVANASLNTLQQAQQKQSEQLASGKRINRAADDAAGLLIANRLSSDINATTQGQRNLYDGIGLAQVYEQNLSNISTSVMEMQQLSVAAGNGAYSDADKQALQQQYESKAQEIQATIDNASFAGQPLFDGNSVQFNTGGSFTALKTGDVAAELTTQNVFSADLSTQAGAAAAADSSKNALAYLDQLRSEAGAAINGFASQARNLNNQQVNVSQARSGIQDADYAKTSSDKTATDILAKASVSVALQARISQQQALNLLS